MTPLIAEMVKIAPDPELYQWFDASAIAPEQTVKLDVVNETPLPYDRCAIVGVDGAAAWLILLAQEDDVVAYLGWTMERARYQKHPAFTFTRSPAGIQLMSLDESTPDRETVRGLLATVGAWLNSLDAGSIAHIPTARKSLINSKRAAKGKGPILFDWHTVTIAPATQKMPHKGGTHASPRLHDRRGHWRTHPSGKRVWVKSCKVGDASKGVVFKDYKV